MISAVVYVQPWTEKDKRDRLLNLLPGLMVETFDSVRVTVSLVDREHSPLEPSPQIEVEVPQVCLRVPLEGSACVLAGLIYERFPGEPSDFSVNVKCGEKSDFFRVP
jgi:hypothetical protein